MIDDHKAQTNIQRRVLSRVRAMKLTGAEVTRRINASELYGQFSHTTYRMLVTHAFEDRTRPRVTFNRQLLIALSEALECTLSDLASDRDLEQIRDVPYRRNQWPAFMLEEFQEDNPRASVTSPKVTAQRIVAYSKQHAYNNASELAARLRDYNYRITNRDMRYVWEKEPESDRLRYIVTFSLCEAVAKVFRGKLNQNDFDPEWLVRCTATCPHCNPIYING